MFKVKHLHAFRPQDPQYSNQKRLVSWEMRCIVKFFHCVIAMNAKCENIQTSGSHFFYISFSAELKHLHKLLFV